MRKLSFGQLLVAGSLTVAGAAAQAASHGPHWDYKGKDGPAHWAELDPAFEACAKGSTQSPINIDRTEKADLPALDFMYSAAVPTIVNNGHTVQVNLPAGQSLKIGDKSYELLQFHFHTPSEEKVRGKHMAMVAHFVHKNAEGALAVVGVLIQPGVGNKAFAPVLEHLPRSGERITVDDLQLDLPAMLPKNTGYYAFAGSLTTPPCSEGVSWMVLKQPITFSARQLATFRSLFSYNARPVQALNERVVQESK